jgi:hypothetical protein
MADAHWLYCRHLLKRWPKKEMAKIRSSRRKVVERGRVLVDAMCREPRMSSEVRLFTFTENVWDELKLGVCKGFKRVRFFGILKNLNKRGDQKKFFEGLKWLKNSDKRGSRGFFEGLKWLKFWRFWRCKKFK